MYMHTIYFYKGHGKSMEPPQYILISDNKIFVNCYTKLHITEEVLSISNREAYSRGVSI